MRSGGEDMSNPLAGGGKRLIHTYLGKAVYVHCRRWLTRGVDNLTIRPKTESIVSTLHQTADDSGEARIIRSCPVSREPLHARCSVHIAHRLT